MSDCIIHSISGVFMWLFLGFGWILGNATAGSPKRPYSLSCGVKDLRWLAPIAMLDVLFWKMVSVERLQGARVNLLETVQKSKCNSAMVGMIFA